MKLKKRKVASYDNIPKKLPIALTLVVIIFMDYFSASEWVLWLIGSILSLLWIIRVFEIIKQEPIDIFKAEDDKIK